MQIREVALKNFGENNIKPGAPLATLEEVLVPVYFFHRYQLEAAVKMIGGLNYRYALRGDGQPVAELLTPEQETKALDELLKTVDPSALVLPERILNLIPPRALGYSRHRELVKIKTDLTFDPISVAETAADMTFSLILHPARANRLIEHHARNQKLPSLESVIDKLIAATFKSTTKPGLEGSIQMATNYVLFTNLTKLALHKNASAETRAITFLKLDQLKTWLATKVASDEEWKAHYNYVTKQIAALQENPDEYKVDSLLPPPPGMPIGDCEINFLDENR
jgi:hypothetical protein